MKHIPIGKHISSIYRHLSIILNDLFADLNIGSSQYLFLIRIADNEGITQKQLCDMIQIDRANTQRAIQKLLQLNYIIIQEDENDKRNKRNYLTPLGHQTAHEIRKRLSTLTKTMSVGLSEQELILFMKTLEKVEKNVQDAVETIKEDKLGN